MEVFFPSFQSVVTQLFQNNFAEDIKKEKHGATFVI
jgi:hypothetical protein